MREACFNLFLYGDDLAISKLGVAVHQLDGSDQEKVSVLTSLVATDYEVARQYPLQNPLEWSGYHALQRVGQTLKVFEHVFRDLDAPIQLLIVVTPVVNGKPHFEAQLPVASPIYRSDLKGHQFGRAREDG